MSRFVLLALALALGASGCKGRGYVAGDVAVSAAPIGASDARPAAEAARRTAA